MKMELKKMRMEINDLILSGRSSEKAKIVGERNHSDYRDSLIERKKLCILINFDNTLVDMIDWCDYAKYDREYMGESGVQRDLKEGQLHVLFYPLKSTVKLRPYIRSFLEVLRPSYDIVMYSKHSPKYVDVMRRLLDRDGANYFKMICLQNSNSLSELEPYLSNPEMLIILDDTEKGWEKYSDNLIKVAPYAYFTRVKMTKPVHLSWTRLKGDECEQGGELYRIRSRLGSIRNIFYRPDYDYQDVRQIMHKMRSNQSIHNFQSCHV